MRIQGGVDSTDIATRAAINGMKVNGWVNDKVVGTTDLTILTDATLYYNLVDGEAVVMTTFRFGISTNSDNCHYEVGWTTGAAGTGDFTALGGHFEFSTGTAASGSGMSTSQPIPPGVVRYSKGARSITWRVEANDNSCAVAIAWAGFRICDECS